jgi:uncharacterized membrane protein YeaQ/YmgE (transglycosylase-associated protein family)
VNASRISKIAGLSLAGVVVASIAADKANLGPVASQIAGFAGAFIGTLVARRRPSRKTEPTSPTKEEDEPPPVNRN